MHCPGIVAQVIALSVVSIANLIVLVMALRLRADALAGFAEATEMYGEARALYEGASVEHRSDIYCPWCGHGR